MSETAYRITIADFSGGRVITTAPVWQYSTGQVLQLEGLELPASFRVDFGNEKTRDYTKPQLATSASVAIPDEYFLSGKPVYAFVVLSDGEGDSGTEYVAEVPVLQRSKPTNYTPNDVQQSVIDQLIAALNTGVEDAEQSAEDAEAQALKAEGYAVGTQDGTAVEEESPYYQNNALYYAGQAAGKATEAGTAASAAGTAKDDAVAAKNAAVQAKNAAETAKQEAQQLVEGAEQEIADAKNSAVQAVNSAGSTAVQAVNSAGSTQVQAVNNAGSAAAQDVNSAKAAAIQAVNDAGATQTANAKAQADAAAQSASAAETAKDDAVAAKNAAVQAKEAAEAAAAHLTTDAALDTESENPVQNKVITADINHIYSILTATGDDMYRMMLESGVPYKTVLKSFLLANGVNAMTDISALLDRWYTLSRTGWTGGTIFDLPVEGQSMNSDGTRTGDNIGMSCTPSTRIVAGQDDYASVPLFTPIDCNVYLDTDGKPHITAADIDDCGPAFERYNAAKIVGVLQMTGWIKMIDNSSGWGIDYTDQANTEGYMPFPGSVDLDGTVRSWMVHGKYNFGEGWTCCSGVKSKIWNVSHNSQLSGIRTAWGTRYCGATSADDFFLKIMLWLKYARLDSDRVLQGCCNYNYEYQPALAETGVERILLTPAQAANLEIGSSVVLAASKRAASNVVDRCKITLIETVEIGGVSYGAVYVDNGGTTFDTTTELWLSTIAWETGSTDDVLGNDGGINPNSPKFPVKLQGVEYMLGYYEAMGDTILSFEEIDGVKCQVANVCRDATKLATSVTSDYITCAYGVPRPASAGWTWGKRMGIDPDLPEVLIPSVVGGSSSTGTRDGFYEEANTATGLREWLRCGDLSSGLTAAGLSCGDGDVGLGGAGWRVGGRLSLTGNRGEFQAAA